MYQYNISQSASPIKKSFLLNREVIGVTVVIDLWKKLYYYHIDIIFQIRHNEFSVPVQLSFIVHEVGVATWATTPHVHCQSEVKVQKQCTTSQS